MWNIEAGPLILSHCRPFFEGCSPAGTGGKANSEFLTLCGWQWSKFDELHDCCDRVVAVSRKSSWSLSLHQDFCCIHSPMQPWEGPVFCVMLQTIPATFMYFLMAGPSWAMVSQIPDHAHIQKNMDQRHQREKRRETWGFNEHNHLTRLNPQSPVDLDFRNLHVDPSKLPDKLRSVPGMCQAKELWKIAHWVKVLLPKIVWCIQS